MGGAQAAMLAAQTGEFGLAGATATASAGGAGAGGFGALLSNPVTIGLGVVAALAMSGAFSRKHAQHNLEGTFGGDTGFEGNWHDYYKGGMLRSSKTENTPLDSTTLNALRAAWKAQEAAITDYAKVLGLSTENIEGFTYRINLKLKDLGDPEAAGYMDKVWQSINQAIRDGSNEMAQLVIGSWEETTETVRKQVQGGFWDDPRIYEVEETVTTRTYTPSEFARDGEAAIDTLTRLATSLVTVNSAFDTLGYSLLSASLASGDLASKLLDQFGGVDAFGQIAASYWQGYYSEAERIETLTRQLTAQFQALGYELPDSRDQLRQWIEEVQATGLATDESRALFASLMQLSVPLQEIRPHIDELGAAIIGADGAISALEETMMSLGQSIGGPLADVIRDGLLLSTIHISEPTRPY